MSVPKYLSPWIQSSSENMILGQKTPRWNPTIHSSSPTLRSTKSTFSLQTECSWRQGSSRPSVPTVLGAALPNSQGREIPGQAYQNGRNWGRATMKHLKEAQRSHYSNMRWLVGEGFTWVEILVFWGQQTIAWACWGDQFSWDKDMPTQVPTVYSCFTYKAKLNSSDRDSAAPKAKIIDYLILESRKKLQNWQAVLRTKGTEVT